MVPGRADLRAGKDAVTLIIIHVPTRCAVADGLEVIATLCYAPLKNPAFRAHVPTQATANVAMDSQIQTADALHNVCRHKKVYVKASLQVSPENEQPIIHECELTLAYIRPTDKKQLFYFNGPCTNNTIWCNQELFNYAMFNMSSYHPPLEYIPPPPSYVREHGFGIVYSEMHVTHTKLPRQNSISRFVALDHTYTCPGISRDSPKSSSADCSVSEENYKINIEHGDEFNVKFITKSGGYRQLYDKDNGQYSKQYYTGQESSQNVQLKFDFIAPVHCSEANVSAKCARGETPINIEQDITTMPINITCDGWSDELSGIAYYYLEIFRLGPNIHDELTELEPLKPIFTFRKSASTSSNFPTYTPDETGMYSILVHVSDMANNSRVARRLVLYDKGSSITLTKSGFLSGQPMNATDMNLMDGSMHVISAIPGTGYMWQTSKNNTATRIVLDWQNHFENKPISAKKLLNKVLPYPIQFADLEDDGVLRSKMFVSLDDNEGRRSLDPIPNKQGIVKFEIKRVYTDDRSLPTSGWTPLGGLEEKYEFEEVLADGSHVRLWVRATDIMNNTLADYTEVHIDNTPPRVGDTIVWNENVQNGSYHHTSRIKFSASDDGSGVHAIEYVLYVGNNTKEHDAGNISANMDLAPNACDKNPACICILRSCFLMDQMLDIDNCMFLVPKEELNSTGRIDVKVYNQALLFKTFSINVTRLSSLEGLEEYSGPTNIRVEKNLATGVRLVWDLPKKASCYGRADILVILVDASGTVRAKVPVFGEQTSVDLVGLSPEEEYNVAFTLGYKGVEFAGAQPYTFRTAAQEHYLSGGAVSGIVVGVLAIIGALLVAFVVMLRRGHMVPVRRGLNAMSVKYRKSIADFRSKRLSNIHTGNDDNRDSIYMYEEMDLRDVQTWQLRRDDVILQSMLKSGSFANIYLATIRSSNETVVAKALKEGYSKEDELLMMAKINFSSMEIGKHENVLKFIGAVCTETGKGMFIIYEYCEEGTLKVHLESLKNSVTLETHEKLLRYGLGIARGMEYLAGRKIVHRRLAARNVLLNAAFEVKIYGFGPQPDQSKDGDDQRHKRERVPLKWMAPECLKTTIGATEKSDVWSFGVVLWEIFSLGENPYNNIRCRDFPAQLEAGYRLPKPEQCDDKWYGVMKRAWEERPEKRPTFKQIRTELDEGFVAAPKDDYYYYRN